MHRKKPFSDAFDGARKRSNEIKHHGDLTTAERNSLPDSAFALPGKRYPIHDENHARNALARVSQFGTPDEKEAVRSAVQSRYPQIAQERGDKVDEMKAQEATLEHTKKKGAKEKQLESEISSMTGKPYIGKR